MTVITVCSFLSGGNFLNGLLPLKHSGKGQLVIDLVEQAGMVDQVAVMSLK